jgi:glycosyltransferase involved in cell wall biosynthesis
MTPLRVLHVITMLELGGAQRNTLDTVASLDRGRFAPGLACAVDGELVDEARALSSTELFFLPHLRREVRPWHDLRALTELRAVCRRFRPDLVHTHSSKAGILGRLAARAERVPITVHSIHGFGFGTHQPWPVRWVFLTAERLAARSTTAFIAVSQRNLNEGVRLGLFRAEQARVIRSGIDLDVFRAHAGGAALRRELMIPATAPLVVQIACFKPQKAPERFVALAAALAARVPEAHFLLVGDGELRPQLERQRAAAGLEKRLHLPGWRRDMPAVLDAAAVVTLTSRFEGLPRALVEALAASVPVVAMAVDGVPEVVHDGGNGFLVGAGDVSALTARVAEILHNRDVRARLAGAAGSGLEEFDRRAMIGAQERLYEELACQTGLR